MTVVAVLLIGTCIGLMIVVGYRMSKDSVKPTHLALILLSLFTAVLLSFGAKTARQILGLQEFIIALFELPNPDATKADLEHALAKAPSDQDRLLAFDVYSREHPEAALTWLRSPSSAQVLRDRPSIDAKVNDRKSQLTARVLTDQVRRGDGKVSVTDPALLGHLLDTARENDEVRTFFATGRFDVTALDQRQLAELLHGHNAQRQGDRIIVARQNGG